MKKILILEGNKDLLEVLQIALQQMDYTVVGLLDKAKVFPALSSFNPHLLMMGVNRTTTAYKEFIHKITSAYAMLPIIAISGNPTIQSLFKKMGFAACLSMPFLLEELYHTVQSVLTSSVLSGSL